MQTWTQSDGKLCHPELHVGVCNGELGRTEGRTADPSSSLRFGRDDKGEGGALSES